MFYIDLWFWATIMLLVLLLVALRLHFKNPYPLIQIPELPHHLYFVPDEARRALATICHSLGHEPYGIFEVAGANQLLLRNGTTILGRKDVEAGHILPTLALPVLRGNGADALYMVASILNRGGIRFIRSTVPQSGDNITRFTLTDYGFVLAIKPRGREMQRLFGFPKFKRDWLRSD